MAIDYKLSDGVARIVIDDGKMNVMSARRLLELSAALARARKADAIVVVTGRPGIFSAGFDMNTLAAGVEESLQMLSAGVDAIIDILSYPKPVITCCTGHAFPMGAFLMLAADIRLGLNGRFQIGMNETAIKIDVPDFALALANARLTAIGRHAIPVARMFEPRDAVLAGYLDYIAVEPDLAATLEQQVSAMKLLDFDAFQSTKARQNRNVIDAVRNAALPDRSRWQ